MKDLLQHDADPTQQESGQMANTRIRINLKDLMYQSIDVDAQARSDKLDQGNGSPNFLTHLNSYQSTHRLHKNSKTALDPPGELSTERRNHRLIQKILDSDKPREVAEVGIVGTMTGDPFNQAFKARSKGREYAREKVQRHFFANQSRQNSQ